MNQSVGVGGYILGGGINVIGTYEKYGTAAEHVKQYTMVDSRGNILLISDGNTTVIEPFTRKALYQVKDDNGLFFAMKGEYVAQLIILFYGKFLKKFWKFPWKILGITFGN